MDAAVKRVFDACGDEADDVLVDYLVSSIGGIDLSDPAASIEVDELLEAHVDSFSALTTDNRAGLVAALVESALASDHVDSASSAAAGPLPKTSEEYQIDMLRDIFPTHCVAAVTAALRKHRFDVFDAADELAASAPAQTPAQSKAPVTAKELRPEQRAELAQIKEFIAARFPFDSDRQVSCHRPTVSYGQENKKKTRYLNNQVVSTRGEKFTFVKTEADVEMEKQMEKTYVQLGTLYTKGKRGA